MVFEANGFVFDFFTDLILGTGAYLLVTTSNSNSNR